jgi:nucleoside 2-deoxyribosyltransferase
MKIYISGKITNNPHYVEDFKEVEEILKSYKDIEPLNPVSLDPVDMDDRFSKDAWFKFMDRDMRLVEECDAIILLTKRRASWKKSPGARIEYWVAKKFNKKIFYGIDHFIRWYNKEKRYALYEELAVF